MTYQILKAFYAVGARNFVRYQGLQWPLMTRSWKYLFKEIFLKRVYAFQSDSEAPFIVDCGSNVGFSVMFFKKCYPNSSILCFEANPRVFRDLSECIERNSFKNVRAYNFALTDQAGRDADFYLDLEGGLGSSLLKRKGMTERVSVPTAPLSQFIDRPVDFIKVDVEGAENSVLRDLDQNQKMSFLKKGVIEFHCLENNSLATTLGLLEKNGFKYKIASCDPDAVIIEFEKR